MERSLWMQKNRLLLTCMATMGMWFSLAPSVNNLVDSTSNLTFNKAAFQQNNGQFPATLYVGTNVGSPAVGGMFPAQSPYALSSAQFGSPAAVTITPLAPNAGVALNANTTALVPSPLCGQVINNLKLAAPQLPVATVSSVPVNPTVYMVIKPDGTAVLKNTNPLKGADGALVDKDIVALAAGVDALTPTNATIFAAVSQAGQPWNAAPGVGDNRGIALLKPTAAGDQLATYNPANISNGNTAANNAQKLSLAATSDTTPVAPAVVGPVAFFGTGAGSPIANATLAAGANSAEMFWNNALQTLYVGLNGVGRDDNTKEGGVFGLAMGRFDNPLAPTTFTLQPVVFNPTKALLYGGVSADQNINTNVLGFYYDGLPANNGQDNVSITVKQMRNMLTSTGNNYLIVNSNINDATTPLNSVSGISALPLLGTTFANGAAVPPAQVGTLSAVDSTTGLATFNGPPLVFDDMPKVTDFAVLINSKVEPIDVISDIFVVGDTVYACLNDDTETAQAGIFASTALFDATTGAIRDWTPTRRVFGSVQTVVGGGLDTGATTPGQMFALTNNDYNALTSATNTVRISQWGVSDTDGVTSGESLSDLLEELFPQAKGGVISFQVFDQNTPGLNGVINNFAMAVAVGIDTVALIQIGKDNGAGQFAIEKNFVEGTNVFVFDTTTPAGAAIADIMPLTCVEVAREVGNGAGGAGNTGWVFVGGYNGVAVLSLAASGQGWNSVAGLNGLGAAGSGNFPDSNIWSFTQLNDANNHFNSVLKLMARNGTMYVVTLGGVFTFTMAANKFNPTAGAAAVADVPVAGLPANTLVADLVLVGQDNDPANVAQNRGILATSNGVFATDFTATPPVLVQETKDLALQLFALGDQASGVNTNANILALGTDFSLNNDTIYGFDVPDRRAALNKLVVPFTTGNNDTNDLLEFNESKQGVTYDGTFLYATLPKSFGETSYVELYQPAISSGGNDVTSLLGVDTSVNKYVGRVVQDTASGMLVVPGDWGVRVNE